MNEYSVTNNLITFRILFLVKGILTLAFSFLPMIHVGTGVFLGSAEFTDANDAPPFNIGVIFVVIGIVALIFIVTIGF